MLSALTTKVRLVRCPKCRQLLPELPDFQVYMCGGCGATLKARDRLPLLGNGSHDGNSDHDDQHYWKTGSDDSSLGDYDEQINVASVVFQGSVDSNPSVSPLASISARVGSDDFNPRVSTDYDDRAL
ncbi:hypothetical protein PRUPE_4G213000 [Prunus persica]|uniref:Enhanced disease resistance 4-like N-terminal domain-containing protein n=1 Tax=Prunus persica TaxID=3760 RepID=A0A251PNY2_PRUPE|nr:hypothetical protein PRUPE_4G213000 [Prunus persica]